MNTPCLPEQLPSGGKRLPEPARLRLAKLDMDAKIAKRVSDEAQAAVVEALGFDLKDEINLNLDTGEIAVQHKEAP